MGRKAQTKGAGQGPPCRRCEKLRKELLRREDDDGAELVYVGFAEENCYCEYPQGISAGEELVMPGDPESTTSTTYGPN